MELRLTSEDTYVDRYELLDAQQSMARIEHGKGTKDVSNWFTVNVQDHAQFLVRLTQGNVTADKAVYERLMCAVGEHLDAVRALLCEQDSTRLLSVIAPGMYADSETLSDGKVIVRTSCQNDTKLFSNRRELDQESPEIAALVAAVRMALSDAGMSGIC